MTILILRILAAAAAAILLGFFVTAAVYGVFNIGSVLGIALCLWVIFLCIAPVHGFVKSLFFKTVFTKIVYRAANICFAAIAVYGVLVTSAMVWAACQTPSDGSTAVVLGAQVKPWGPSVILEGRINAAEKYLDDSPLSSAVLSGGQGSDEITSEAECMYSVMSSNGIDVSRLYKEDKSSNTTENIGNSVKVIEENGLNGNIAVVSDGFHQLRARIICMQLGVKSNVGAVNSDTRLLYVPTFVVREWIALPYQLLFR